MTDRTSLVIVGLITMATVAHALRADGIELPENVLRFTSSASNNGQCLFSGEWIDRMPFRSMGMTTHARILTFCPQPAAADKNTDEKVWPLATFNKATSLFSDFHIFKNVISSEPKFPAYVRRQQRITAKIL